MYLKASRSFVNLAAVEHVEPLATARGVSALKLTSDKNRELGVVSSAPGEEAVDLERLTAPLVPASATPSLAVFVCVEQTVHRPTLDDVQVHTAAVVAWRVTRNGAEPVYLGPKPAGVMHLGVAGGKLLEAMTGRIHGGVEEVKQAVLDAVQTTFDRDHQVEHEAEVVDIPKVAASGGRRRG